MAMQRRQSSVGKPQESAAVLDGGDFSKWWPNVIEFLSRSRWEDGQSRLTGTVMLFAEGGLWKVWVHDRDTQEGMFLSASSPAGVLASLDEVLANGNGDWRADKGRRK